MWLYQQKWFENIYLAKGTALIEVKEPQTRRGSSVNDIDQDFPHFSPINVIN